MDENRLSKVKKALAILLILSLVALGAVHIYKNSQPDEPISTVVPDNITTSEKEDSGAHSDNGATNSDKTAATVDTTKAESKVEIKKDDVQLELHKTNLTDNSPFKVMNMFPGDVETKNFQVKVYHKGDVTVRFRADIPEGQGYEKLAEVLMAKVVLTNTNEVLYDGLMRDMPKSLEVKTIANESEESVLGYEISGYLDTSVGNEYQNKVLEADFKWWVEESDKADLVVKTGDTTNIIMWVGIAALAAIIIFLLARKKRKEDN